MRWILDAEPWEETTVITSHSTGSILNCVPTATDHVAKSQWYVVLGLSGERKYSGRNVTKAANSLLPGTCYGVGMDAS